MFKRKKELQSLVNSSRKSLANAEEKIENINYSLEYVKEKEKKLKNVNLKLCKENKDLRFENEEQSILISKIKKLTEQNTYSNEIAILCKIKELVCDYQSIN